MKLKRPSFIKDFFDFSQKEMNGFIILTAIMITAIGFTILYDQITSHIITFTGKDKKILDSLVVEIKIKESDSKKIFEDKNSIGKPTIKIERFHFNPNTASKEQFQALGLHTFIAERIIKYRSKGGKFKIKSDLKKIYGFPEKIYYELEPFIDLPQSLELISVENSESKPHSHSKDFQNYQNKPSKEFKKQDLNLADSVALEKVYGIGFKLANRIIKYREKLGGFILMNQLREVWGLDSTTIQKIEKKFEITADFQPKKINANTDDFQLLKSHPYIGFNKAKLILNFRKMHGTYHGIDQLNMIQAISAEDIEKIKPYLEF